MFEAIKSKVPLLAVILKDTGKSLVQSGENFVIEDEEEQGGCPFCGHKDCFRVKSKDEEDLEGFYKCFSCDEKGDVISWRAAFKKISLSDAVKQLASEYDVDLPFDLTTSPVQAVMNAAANYYSTTFWECKDVKFYELNKATPLEYQLTVRGHKESVLRDMNIGWSDGGLVDFLLSIGTDEEILEQTGLKGKKQGDYLPKHCFIYPHYVKGKVSHFTFKDPLKRLTYQLPKKFSLNGYQFYNQDSIAKSSTVVIVEGENDLLALLNTGEVNSVLATIGQISVEQLSWMRDNLADKKILTLFDPDEAGDKYRVKVEKNRRFFKNLIHVKPPQNMDIDECLRKGLKLEDIVRSNVVKVDASKAEEKEEKPGVSIEVPWEEDKPSQASVEPIEVCEGSTSDPDFNVDSEITQGSVTMRKRGYYRTRFKDGVPEFVKIANFVLRLHNVFIAEDGERNREVVIIKEDGYTSEPFMVNSEIKVKAMAFKVLAARVADATFRGTDDDLASIWEIVMNQAARAEVRIPRVVGRHEKYAAWIFRNKVFCDSGDIIESDEDGIFWLHGRSIGLRPDSLSREEGGDSGDKGDIPDIITDLTVEERDQLLEGVIRNLGKNLNCMGKAITMVAWTYASVYSNFIFDLNRGFPFLFFWGVNGQGKSTVAKWVTQEFFGINGHGSTSVPMLNSGVGWGRKSEYYASIPLFIDEVRSDEETKSKLGVFRSYYDREARTIGLKDSFGVKNIRPKATFVFNGEDQFEDPATRERCIPIRIPVKGRELQESYRWMEEHKHLFTGILYHWLIEFGETMRSPEKKEVLKAEMRLLDKKLHADGCSQRTSKNWSAIGIFGHRLAAKYIPEYDYAAYLTEASVYEAVYQKSDTTLMQFWELVEGELAQENSSISDKHVMRKDDLLHIWFSPVFKIVQNETRGKFPFSRNAVLSAIREEPYFVSDNRKVSMGLDGARRIVITLDLTKAPDTIRNIGLAN